MNQAFVPKMDETQYLRCLVRYLIYALIISGLLGHVSCLAYAVFKTRIQPDINMTTKQAILELPKISQSWTISYKLMLEIWSSGHFRVNVWLFLHFWILGKVSRRSSPVLIWLVIFSQTRSLDHFLITLDLSSIFESISEFKGSFRVVHYQICFRWLFSVPNDFLRPQTTLTCTSRKLVSIFDSWPYMTFIWPNMTFNQTEFY